jgi:UDP-N-acetylmuramate dehydrogenase
VGAGEEWDDFVRFSVEKNISGIENLSAIPGEVGATPIQNIGAYGVEVKDVIAEVHTIEIKTAKKRVFSNEECCFGYRDSIFKQALKGQYIVTYVVYRLKKLAEYSLQYGNLSAEVKKYGSFTLENIRKAVVAIRSEKLPDHRAIGNAGSFFMNPIISRSFFEVLQSTYPSIPYYFVSETEVKVPAGWLIEQCGWKGKSHGNAAVHDKQALVLINKGNATGKEIMELASLIEKSVQEKFGITIHPEVIVVF